MLLLLLLLLLQMLLHLPLKEGQTQGRSRRQEAPPVAGESLAFVLYNTEGPFWLNGGQREMDRFRAMPPPQ